MIGYGTVQEHPFKERRFIAGKEVTLKTVFAESVTVHTDDEVLEVFKSLLELRRKGEVHNPSISLEEYTDTGKLKRIVKSWSVYE